MKVSLEEKFDNYSKYSIKYKSKIIYFYIDNVFSDKIETLKLRVCKRNIRDIDDINKTFVKYRIVEYKNNNSLMGLLTGIKNKYYLKDTFSNKNEEIIDYRLSNVTTSVKEVIGYTDFARKKIEMQDTEYMYECIRIKRYTKNYSKELAKSKTGQFNPCAKLNSSIVGEIRAEYNTNLVSQQYLANKYNVGRCTIADILNYRTWVLKDDLSLRQFKKDKTLEVVCCDKIVNENIYDNLKQDYVLYYIKNHNINIYIEKLPIDRLLYMEIRDKNDKFIVNCDLYFKNDICFRMKKGYIISSTNPVKFNKSDLINYINLLSRIK